MGFPKHPVFSGSTFGLMSAEKPLFQPQVQGGHESLGQTLQQMGLHAEPTSGKYKEPERSYIIHGATQDQMRHLGKIHGQESVVHSQNGQHKLIYTNGEHEGKYHASDMQNPLEHFEQPPEDFYTSIPGHGHFRINFDWSKMHDLNPVNKTEREFEPELAAFLMKNAIADLLASQAPTRPHPHFYDWHDGNTGHHTEDLAAPKLPGLAKAESTQYRQFALPYGDVQPGSKPDLLHYNYHGKLPEIQGLVQDHGYKTYYAGGKYGQPDLANKNYNTGHLAITDPSHQDFGHEHYTNGWRQMHELAHALTLPELNKIYGEGKRTGKLGTDRNVSEALRAVHWEWLAAHKQRELSKQIGVPIKDEDFHKELNTVMHDAVHRTVTGQSIEPSSEGFTPHSHKVPLHTALQMVRDAGNQMGLKGLHDLIPKNPKKTQDLQPATIFSKTEGDIPVADEKLYTPEEAREVLIKAAREKINAYAKEIENLRSRELKKALIIAHKHNQASQASGGIEDVPPGEQNPKGLNKQAPPMAPAATPKPSPSALKPPPSATNLAMSELCKGCGKMHKAGSCGLEKDVDKMVVHGDKKPTPAPKGADYTVRKEKGKTVIEAKKSELVDSKGKRSDNHTVSGSKLPDDAKSKKVNEGTAKNPGSGGIVLPGANLKKAESLSKPPVSEAQRRAMGAAASGKSNLDIPKKVGKEFIEKDPRGKLPEIKKAATPPTAKPPSGVNMGTSVPTSTPKAPKMAKATMPGTKAGDALSAAHKAPVIAAPTPKLPTPAEHAQRAAGFQAAASGAFQPKPAAPKLPGAALGLKSPKAAGVTRSAGPVVNAARPAPAAKPGIFGKLFGGKK